MYKSIRTVDGHDVTNDMLKDAAKLFSENYGIWGDQGAGKPGTRVRMTASRFRAQCLPEGSRSLYAMVTIDGVLAGNVFACRWDWNGRQVCWITQLVVHSDYRRRRLASALLLALIDNDDDDVVGIMSSHPAACKALANAVGGDIRFSDMSLGFARDNAAGVIAASPISYIRHAEPRGSLFFGPDDSTGMVSGVDSNFYVDHDEPLQVLACFTRAGKWPLGNLADGHEFLFLVERPRRAVHKK